MIQQQERAISSFGGQELLERVWQALSADDIRYCVLRPSSDSAQHRPEHTEVDLLVHNRDMPKLRTVLQRMQFAELPSWGHAPHRFFVSYCADEGAWVKLDVVTKLRYGHRVRSLELEHETFLAKRRLQGSIYLLSPEDEFVTLLLHCLLDKRRLRFSDRHRLSELWDRMSGRPEIWTQLSDRLERDLESAVTVGDLQIAVEGQDWSHFEEWRRNLNWELFWQAPAIAIWRRLRQRTLHCLRPILHALRARGVSVALLGPDGAGKTSISTLLAEDPIIRAKRIYMGNHDWRSPLWRRIWQILRELLSLAKARYCKLRGNIVVFDRFCYDAWVSRRLSGKRRTIRAKLVEFASPTPDVVLVLDAPGEAIHRRKQEHTPDWLERQRCCYLALQDEVQATVVDVSRPLSEVQHKITSLVWDLYRSRLNQGSTNGSDH